jgi:hypothetical protein
MILVIKFSDLTHSFLSIAAPLGAWKQPKNSVLRSWVQIPLSPSLTTRGLRHGGKTSAFIGLPFAKAKDYAKLTLVLKYVAAVIILIIGAGLVYELGVVEQVFL